MPIRRERLEKGLGGDHGGSTASGIHHDLAVTRHDGEPSRGRGSSDQPENQVIGGDARTGESHVDPPGLVDLMRLVHPVAYQYRFLASKTAFGDQDRQFLEINARKVRRQDTDDVKDVVRINQKRHGVPWRRGSGRFSVSGPWAAGHRKPLFKGREGA